MLCRESEDETEEEMVCKRRRRDGSHHPEPGAYNVHSLQELPLGTYVEFLTDVEGNWEYFLHFTRFSKILHWEGPNRGAGALEGLALRLFFLRFCVSVLGQARFFYKNVHLQGF